MTEGSRCALWGGQVRKTAWTLLIGIADSVSEWLAGAIGPSIIAQIIGVIGFGVLVQFFVLPYMDLTYAGYYVELTKPKADAGFADGWTPEL